ncbi:ScbA/BarX family gamma-butyrolactone biosynthesis protein [Streptomyces sp. NPDC004286]|uniref:ScbA/BarX family gamma-butyrolactone biosynthesis protein n=1 Tax=Streptomyces sp. NPDC004286 TaxID=3364696 RepID=UPI0036CC7B7B
MQAVPGPEMPTCRPGPERHWATTEFDQRVPRESVHKTADSEVLLTDAVRLGHERFAVAACWSRDHYLAHHGAPSADPVLLMETARQTAIYLSHRFLDVPYDHSFVLSGMSVDLYEALPPVAGGLPVSLDVICSRPAQGARRLRLELESSVLVGNRQVGRVGVHWEPIEPRLYARLRRRDDRADRTRQPLTEPSRASLRSVDVGQVDERDVLIDTDPLRTDSWWLRLDLPHPVLFDHESDHVPGMALVEAFRQAGRVAAAGRRADVSQVTLLDVAFRAFGELDTPVAITAAPAGPDGNLFALSARQGDLELARATVRCGTAQLALPRLETAC